MPTGRVRRKSTAPGPRGIIGRLSGSEVEWRSQMFSEGYYSEGHSQWVVAGCYVKLKLPSRLCN